MCFGGATADTVAGLSVMSQEQTRDYYEDLQVSSSAEPETIHREYARLLAQQFHPDNGETGNESRFRAIAEATRCSAIRVSAHDTMLSITASVRIGGASCQRGPMSRTSLPSSR